jgi:hypothetical protein
VTIIAGAGLSSAFGLPTTDDLTALIRQPFNRPYHPLVFEQRTLTAAESFWLMALGYYERPNFEMMLHLAETALAYRKANEWLGANDRAKPAFGAFMNVMPHWSDLTKKDREYEVRQFIENSTDLIARRLVEDAATIAVSALSPLERFLTALKARYRLTVASLNYDDLIERIIGTWSDGFVDDGDRFRFVAESLLDCGPASVLLHLHGSVRWYVPVGDEISSPFEILRADDGNYPCAPGRRRPVDMYAQSGDPMIIGPMIAGLRKSDKIAIDPFATYQWKLRDSLLRNERLIVIGYGGWDLYLTTALQHFSRMHGAKARIAIVTLRKPASPWEDQSVLMFAKSDLQISNAVELGEQLDNAFRERRWFGNATTQVFTNGFALDGEPMGALETFLSS